MHQGIHSLGGRLEDVDETLMSPELKMLHGFLVDVGRADDAVDIAVDRERDGARDPRTCPFDRIHDLLRGLVENFVVVGLQLDPDLLCHLPLLRRPTRGSWRRRRPPPSGPPPAPRTAALPPARSA